MHQPGHRERERLFALILTQHRRWGTVLVPYILEKQHGRDYYLLAEALAPFPDGTTLSELDNEEREIVRLVNEYSDRHLYRLFSKHKNVKEFLGLVTDREFGRLIKPYIESRIHHCLHIALNEEIPVYIQKLTTLHPEDRLTIAPEEAKPVFRFDRNSEGSSYSLTVEYNGIQIDLRKPFTEILSNKPCVIRSDRTLLFVSEIEGTKLRPFLERDKISIPGKAEEKYFSTFVLSVINSHKVTGSGFTLEEKTPAKQAFITLERTVIGYPALLLTFRYDDRTIFSSDELTHFTTFSNEQGRFIFTRKDRDLAWEKRCVGALNESGFFTEDGIMFMTPGATKENDGSLYDLIEAIAFNRQRLEEAGMKVRTGSLEHNYSLEPVTLNLSHELINDWFDLKAVVQIGSFTIPFTRLRRNILDGVREYTLPDGTVAILPEEWFTRYRGLFEMGRDREESIMLHKQHFALVSDIVSGDDGDTCNRLDKLSFPDQIPLLISPAAITTELRPYQAEGLSWLHYLQTQNLGGCLADDMGLGKTLQALALLAWNKENRRHPSPEEAPAQINPDSHARGESPAQIKEDSQCSGTMPVQMNLFSSSNHADTSLVIVPASLCHNWYNEIKKFCPSLTALIHHGPGRQKSAAHFYRYDLIISSYHTVRQDIEILSGINFFYVILDESQHIKNPTSNIYRSVMRLRSSHRLVLSGTPVENSLTDLWTQLSFVNPGLLGSLTFFRREFARPIEKNFEEEKENRLRKIIQPFIMRRTKEMVVTELPPVTEQVIHCDMSDEQAAIYEREKSAVRNSILENIESVGMEKSAIMVLQGLMRLRQIANHPILTDDSYSGGSGKYDTVIHNIESVVAEGHKILVFSSFVKHLELFPDWLTANGIGFAMLTGSTRNREGVIESFRRDKSIRVFLISLKAGGVGLNLTEADYVFILDPWWNPASEIQALSRAHRIGQEKRVFVSRYISEETIEEKILRLQDRKSKLAGTFAGMHNPFEELDVKEMIEIMS
ncbi:MAG: SNF2-related protein [Bacteroidales bacterium]|nr:SNF2-related protein [Bacteroidales bacterium]MDT8374115.1 SNF2-related protein [Bacteroidales bacterium]